MGCRTDDFYRWCGSSFIVLLMRFPACDLLLFSFFKISSPLSRFLVFFAGHSLKGIGYNRFTKFSEISEF